MTDNVNFVWVQHFIHQLASTAWQASFTPMATCLSTSPVKTTSAGSGKIETLCLLAPEMRQQCWRLQHER